MAQLPERLGKYQITGVLGEGAMGVVYRGFDPDIRRVVALKTIRHQPSHDAHTVANSAARFRNEAQAAGRLMHPGIVGVYDFGEAQDASGRVAYIAMEFVEGHTLSPYLSRKVRFSDADIASIGTQLLDALGHAHEHGVWHRDVKPSNVIMTQSGRVKVADFGIARTDNSGLTMANNVLGTPMYMAPEQFMGRPFDHRVDLYGVAVLLYQLVAGRPPFVGPPESLMYRVVHEPAALASSVEGARGSAVFDAVLAQALAKDPAARFASGVAFRQALADALAQAGVPAVPSSVSQDVVQALPAPSSDAPTERLQRPASPATHGSLSTAAPTHWDPAVLARVETALARHVGPMARVMVRRAARECQDVPALYTRLGEQITQASAREAFLGLVSGTRGGTSTLRSGVVPTPDSSVAATSASPSASSTWAVPAAPQASSDDDTAATRILPAATGLGSAPGRGAAPPSGPAPVPVSDAWLDQAQRLLAVYVGPIAKVMVRRAAERSRQRDAICAALGQAVPEAARAALLAALSRLH